ncbi:PLC-like phosphodiesterase, TIM beta/alpha-barrel-containing domain containing protein [Amanita muscaria]
MHIRALIIVLFALVLSVTSAPVRRASKATVCNGHSELCSRSYGNVTFIGAHDSFAYSRDPALNNGVRLLQAQSHMFFLYDGGTVLNYLKKVKRFMDQNPNEVLTLLFTNPEGRSVLNVWKPIFDQAGLTSMMYVPPHVPMKYNEWPTLGEMIDSGKRVVVFLDSSADTSKVDFILPEFPMIWETPFGVTDPSFPCSVNRIEGPLATTDHMYMINHSLNKNVLGIVISDAFDAPTTNGVTSILNNANGCVPLGGGRNPNFLLLDFVDLGNAFRAADVLNGFA